MTHEDFRNLDVGDIVKSLMSSTTYVVTGNYGGRVSVVAQADITNPPEWELVNKVTRREDLAK